jgi:hypothetical protein
VDYTTNHVNGMLETGKVIVIAESHEMAHDLVCQQLELPPSRTRCESAKIKPPCYSVGNKQSYPDKKVSVRSAREPLAPRQKFHVTVTASNVNGQSELQAMRKVGEELCARGTQSHVRHNLEMSVDCSTSETSSKSPNTMEKIEMYGARNGRVQGGQVRGR